MKSTLALALALGLPSVVMAVPAPGAGLQQKGLPQADAGTLTTYGIDVPVRTALKSLIPTGWRLFVHKSASLPSAMSWKPGDQWTDVLNKAALSADLATLVDWDTKTVLVRNRETALQESAVRTEIAQAASTPLPRFSSEAPAADKPKEVAPAVAAAAAPAAEASAPAAAAPLYAINTKPEAKPAPAEVVADAKAPDALAEADASLNTNKAPALQAAEPLAALAAAEPVTPTQVTPVEVIAAKETLQDVVAQAEADKLAPSTQAQPSLEVKPAAVEVAAAPVLPVPELKLQAKSETKVDSKPDPAPAAQEPVQVAQVQPSEQVEEAPQLSDKELAQAVARAINERVGAQQTAPRYVVDDQGNITAQDAFGALAAVGTAQEVRRDKAATAADAQELAQDTKSRPAALATLRAMQEAPLVEAPRREFKDVSPTAIATAAPASVPVPVADPVAKPVAPTLVIAKAPTPAPKAVEPAPVAKPLVSEQVFAPSFAQAPAIEPSGVAQPLLTHAAMPAEVPVVPVFRVNPTPEMVKSAAAVAAPARLASTKDFTYTAPVALNKAPAKTVAQAIASRYNLRLVWIAPDIRMQGPVTLLAQSAEQDLELLRKALGRFAPVNLEISPIGDLRVVSKDENYVNNHMAFAAKAAAALAQAEELKQAELRTQGKTPGKASAPGATGATGASSVNAAPALQLVVEAGETLENVLKNFLNTQGYTHEWLVSGGFEANRRLSFEGDNLTEVLSQALPPLGISADIYTTDKHIVIRPGDYRE